MPTPPRAATLDDAYRTCNHDRPLAIDDERYEDLSAARGDDTRRNVKARFMRADEGEFVHVAFVSHRGAGKTTEILRVCDDLKRSFETWYFEANLQLDERHITAEDLLLSLVIGLEEHFDETDRPLPPEAVEGVKKWFAEVIASTAWGAQLKGDLGFESSAGFEVPFFHKVKAELKALLRIEGDYRRQVQEAFRRYPGTLLRHVNNLLDAANRWLGDRRLLLVIDNLDRYDPKVVDELLMGGGQVLQKLRCHLLVTPPIALHLRPVSERLDQHFITEQMFAVRLRNPSQPYTDFDAHAPGRDALLRALDRRMDVDKLIPDVAARDRLVLASGGAIRDLLRLVREAILMMNRGATLDLAAVEKATRRVSATYRDLINANGWADTLAAIMLDHHVSPDERCMAALYQQLALKYNGTVWYDVHPLVAEIPEVLTAKAKLQSERAKGSPAA